MPDWTLYIMSGLYFLAGILHFVKPKMYKAIIPRIVPLRMNLVYLSGLVEIVLAILLLPLVTRNFAIYSIILMLFLFLTVHIYMLSDAYETKIPRWLLWLRIPIQFLLMWWAYQYIVL